jgi:hypothetical protein
MLIIINVAIPDFREEEDLLIHADKYMEEAAEVEFHK